MFLYTIISGDDIFNIPNYLKGYKKSQNGLKLIKSREEDGFAKTEKHVFSTDPSVYLKK